MPNFPDPGVSVVPARRIAAGVGLLVVGGLIGGLLTWHFRDRHTAAAERLTGTVSWSNQETRLIAFRADGEPRRPDGDQTFYIVVADELNYPGCLVGSLDDPVRQDRRRVEVDAVHQSFDGERRVHVALSVRCLG